MDNIGGTHYRELQRAIVKITKVRPQNHCLICLKWKQANSLVGCHDCIATKWISFRFIFAKIHFLTLFMFRVLSFYNWSKISPFAGRGTHYCEWQPEISIIWIIEHWTNLLLFIQSHCTLDENMDWNFRVFKHLPDII